jgi:hypothetical protein
MVVLLQNLVQVCDDAAHLGSFLRGHAFEQTGDDLRLPVNVRPEQGKG